MDVYATDDEKVEQLKKWWKENGRSLVIGVVIGLAVLIGWRTWSHYRTGQAEQASDTYAALMAALSRNDNETALADGERIVSNFSSTPYAALSALALARVRLEQGELTAARTELQWALDHSDMEAVRHIARLRLGRVMLAQGDDAAALKLIAAVKDPGSFASQYDELAGDIYVKQGKPQQARAAYQKAMDSLGAGAAQRPLLEMKLDDVAGSAETKP
ncbi:MAG: tetratricopeptide repeat protein [Gammaproteobacteria bacterium]